VLTLGEIAIPPGISVSGFLPGDPLLGPDFEAAAAPDAWPPLPESPRDAKPQVRRASVPA
jgi:hypothetical protein